MVKYYGVIAMFGARLSIKIYFKKRGQFYFQNKTYLYIYEPNIICTSDIGFKSLLMPIADNLRKHYFKCTATTYVILKIKVFQYFSIISK